MGFKATEWAYGIELSPATKAVLLALAHRADDKTFECYPGQETLASMTGASIRTVSRAINDLETAGVVERKRRRRPGGSRTSDLCVLNRAYMPDSHQTQSHVTESHLTESPKSHATVSKVTGHSGTYIKEDHPEDQSEDHSDSRETLENEFEQFWKVYPRRQAKADARKAYKAAVASASASTILAGARAYALLSAGGQKSFIKLPAGWLRGRRWEDEEQVPATPTKLGAEERARHVIELGRELERGRQADGTAYRIPITSASECPVHPGYPATPAVPCARCERDALVPEGANF